MAYRITHRRSGTVAHDKATEKLAAQYRTNPHLAGKYRIEPVERPPAVPEPIVPKNAKAAKSSDAIK